ncbi:hypothetical protein A7W90_07285 [Clostridium sp. Bc-iso-3]|nr:hypothetical protein A7W90_07285 [Clostridium sp. Bc-iso-3]
MDKAFLSIRNILDIIFKITSKNANILADCYLIKDSSIISKWKNNRAKPKSEDLMKIVDFAYEESTATQRKMIRNEIEILIYNSSLKEEIKESLLRIADFKEFLVEVLNVSLSSVGKIIRQNRLIEQSSEGGEFDRVPDSEAITAFHNSIEGNYSGVMEFNLTLSKSGEDTRKGTLNGVVDYRNNISRNIKSKVGNLQKQLKSKSILGTVILIVVTGFMAAQAASGSQSSKISMPSEKPAEVSQDMSNADFDSLQNPMTIPIQANTSSQELEEVFNEAEADTGVEYDNAESQGVLGTANIETPTDVKSDTAADAASYPTANTTTNSTTGDTTNTTTNTTNTSNTTNSNSNEATNSTISNSVVIEGDNNILGQGSNIYIHIGD